MSMSSEQIAGTAETLLMSVPLQLAEGVELIQGANDQMMLYEPIKGAYIRLSALGVTVVKMLDGRISGFDVARSLQEQYPDHDNIAAVVNRFFADLRRAGVLNLEPAQEQGIKPFLRKVAKRPMLRLPLAKSADRVLGGIARVLLAMPKAGLQAGIALVLSGAAVAFGWELSLYGIQPGVQQVVWPLFIAAFLLHLMFHELSHAVVCSYYGVRIREAGVGLLYYFLPVAYVDRTDAYRLREKKSRAYIALAGPAYDLAAAGFWSAMALVTERSGWGETAHLIALCEVLLLLGNLNLLLPTDGYHALEAASGELILRQRALRYLYYVVTRQALPDSFVPISQTRKWVYLAYASFSFVYVLLILAGILFSIYSLNRM